jgi:glutamate-1-semialdehyde 2,1-aminomutase
MAANTDNVKKDIESRYIERTSKSQKYYTEARKYLPGGETRESTFFKPHPLYMERGKGSKLYDYDGNEYIDFVGNYTTLIHGHCDPDVTRAVATQLELGTVLAAPDPSQTELGKLIVDRLPSADLVRFTNSGTEATHWAIRAARAFTKRDMFLKMDGGYNGSHDAVEINIIPDLNPQELPEPKIAGLGIPQSVLNDIALSYYGDLDSAEAQLKKHRGKIAAVILEPMLGSLGMIIPTKEYLQEMRELTKKYDTLLIFDEVMTFRLGAGGLQEHFGVTPDITALGKVIGGGFPVGGFAGRQDIMDMFEYDPVDPESVNHSGTFNGNNMTMVAGVATLKKFDKKAVKYTNGLGNKLRVGIDETFKSLRMKGQATGFGSLVQIHFTDNELKNAYDYVMGILPNMEVQKLFHLELLNRGIFTAKRGFFATCTPMTESEIDTCLEEVKETLEVLKPLVNYPEGNR